MPLDEDDHPNLGEVIVLSKGYVIGEWRDVYDRALQPSYHSIPPILLNRSALFYNPR